MKNCPNCGNLCDDAVAFCNQCGTPLNGGAYRAYDPADHTAEFEAEDISQNKVLAMLPYLMGWIGIIIALLAVDNSKYVAFHVKQALKIQVVTILLGIVTALLVWTIIVPIAAGVCYIILFVLQIMAFFQICCGKAKELPIIRGLGFLK
ncbi:MAG: zinc ribbon domain-containing protein [Ruminococcaceae bacterium]|nr:zinc ribbon domain-containing protein [Oscillospiraceae bacterium]